MSKAKELIEALLTRPHTKYADPRSADEWSKHGYLVEFCTDEVQDASIYLGHARNGNMANVVNYKAGGERERRWTITHALYRAIQYSPDIVVMTARMKKLMLED